MNALSTSMHLMTSILQAYLGKFVVDDIMIFSGSEEEQIWTIFQPLRHTKLYFEEVLFYGSSGYFWVLVSHDGLGVDPSIVAWATLATLTELRSFHGLVFFYRIFVHGSSGSMAPLTNLTKVVCLNGPNNSEVL